MKMIQAIIRPEKLKEVEDALMQAGFPGLTTTPVLGRGRQKGINVGSVHYDKLPKHMIWVVVPENRENEAVRIIQEKGSTGAIGDGKIFILDVDRVMRIRTKEQGEEVL